MSKGKKEKKTRGFLHPMGKYFPNICRALGCRKTVNEKTVKSYERRGEKGRKFRSAQFQPSHAGNGEPLHLLSEWLDPRDVHQI